jgi:plasmid maintenance system antidote protein VapI
MKFERIHIGNIVKKKVQASGKSVASFAKSIELQRQNIEKTVFEKHSLDTDLLITISEVLDFDFFQYYRQIDESNKKDYMQNQIIEVKGSIKLKVGEEDKEETFTFSFGKNKEENNLEILNK